MSIKCIEVPESIMQMIQPCYKVIIKITKSNNIYLAEIITVSFLNNSIEKSNGTHFIWMQICLAFCLNLEPGVTSLPVWSVLNTICPELTQPLLSLSNEHMLQWQKPK